MRRARQATKKAVPFSNQAGVGIVSSAVARSLVVVIVGAPGGASGLAGPFGIFVVMGPGLSAETMGHDAGHAGLKGQGDEIHHQPEVILHAVLARGEQPDLLLVKDRAASLQNGFPIIKPLFHLPDRLQVDCSRRSGRSLPAFA